MNGPTDPDPAVPAGRGAASAAATPSAAASGGGEPPAAVPAPPRSVAGERAGGGQPGADTAEPGADGGALAPGDVRERTAAVGASVEYLEQTRADVTNIYVYDSRSYGVYAEGTVSAHDISGHDKTVTSDGKSTHDPERARTVSVVAIALHDRDKLRCVAINVGQHERAREILDRERLVVLHGPAGVGKGAAALLLLGLDHEVLGVDPSVTAKDLAEFRQRFPYGPQRRYLVEALSPATAAQLSSFVTRTVTRDLGDEESYLIITVDDRVSLSPELAEYVVPWRDRPDAALALRSHLAYYLAEGDVAAVENRFDLVRLSSDLTDRSLRSVDEVARAVVKAFNGSQSFESLLDDLGFGAAARVAKWFSAERSPDELGFLLSVAVLGGCPYSTVARHARRLEKLIADGHRISLSKRRADPLRSRSRRVHEAMAMLEPGFVDTEYGRSPAETVRLESRWLVHGVLDIVWREYDLVADALLAWLYEAGDDLDPSVRLRAAAAAGWLSQYEFAAVRQRLLVPWAVGSSEAARAAADALGQATWFDSTAPLALGLLNVWARREQNYDLWWTAAVAYGGEVGVRHPSVAMDQMLAIVLRGDHRAPSVVAESAVRLVTSGGRFAQEIAAHVLNHLTRWLRQGLVAALTAQRVYVELLRRASDPDWPAATDYWRLLIAPENRDTSADLLRATLAERTFRADALDSLASLVRAVDQDQDSREKLEGLLMRVADGPGSTAVDGQRLLHYLNRWASNRDPSPTARVIAGRLQELTVK